MTSLLIGIARPGTPYDEVLNPRNDYISLCGNKPEVSFSIQCGQHEFIEWLNGLRYDDADPSSSAGAIAFFQTLTTKIFSDLTYAAVDESNASPLHLRLVTAPFELAQIPFEFVQLPNSSGESLLVNSKRKVTLTREVRQETEARYVWPHHPRILFAWAQPGGDDMAVPQEEHLAALKELVSLKAKPKKDSPNPEPYLDDLLTELPNASIASIKQKIAEAIKENNRYTHLHILAHGGEAFQFGVQEFQLLLCEDGAPDSTEKTDGKTLSEALLSTSAAMPPTVVSLSVCDSGNMGNTILPSGSLVYQLHTAGIPCVFASQFPLTQRGSVTLVKTLYEQLISACDPRMALYETRKVLKEAHATHDWASLVAYARFPEDIEEQLQDAELKNLFGSMTVTNAWVDHVFKFWDKIEAANKDSILQNLETRLTASIQRLSAFLQPGDDRKSTLENAALQAEHLGLLGSAYKRKAEYLFRLITLYPKRKDELMLQSKEALVTAKEFYRCGLDANPASHWTTMQYLSLKAVTEGSLKDDLALWYVTEWMAQREEKVAQNEQDKIWSSGTLAELHLLKPLTVQDASADEEAIVSTAAANTYMNNLATADKKYNEAKESTARQLERYIGWWPELFSETFPKGIKERAIEIRNVLPGLTDLL